MIHERGFHSIADRNEIVFDNRENSRDAACFFRARSKRIGVAIANLPRTRHDRRLDQFTADRDDGHLGATIDRNLHDATACDEADPCRTNHFACMDRHFATRDLFACFTDVAAQRRRFRERNARSCTAIASFVIDQLVFDDRVGTMRAQERRS